MFKYYLLPVVLGPAADAMLDATHAPRVLSGFVLVFGLTNTKSINTGSENFDF